MTKAILVFESEYEGLSPDKLVLTEAHGVEELSRPYEYKLNLEVKSAGGLSSADIDGLLIKPCVVRRSAEHSSIEIHGVLSELRLIAANDKSPLLYQATLVPRFWRTTLNHRSRVYRRKNIKELVEAVLELSGLDLDVTWWLSRKYPKRKYIVQFEESDFDFISRSLEHWGIFYFFRQNPDGDELVIADDATLAKPREGSDSLHFAPTKGQTSSAGAIHSLSTAHRPRPTKVILRNYNYRIPLLMERESSCDERSGYGEVFSFDDRFRSDRDGDQVASIRAEQLLCSRESYSGTVSVPGLAAGHRFELIDCPVPDLNFTYLVTSVKPILSTTDDLDDEATHSEFTAVPLERDEPPAIPYRSQRTTARPRIEGLIYGFIDGEVRGKAATLDKLGRYRVILPLDSAAKTGGKASRWIRRVQPHGGANQGMHFPLHIGTEVAIAHINGDPDRPVILGAVANAATPPPVVEDDATKNRIKTKSGVLFEIEDDA